MNTPETPKEIFGVHQPGQLFPSFFGDPVIITTATLLRHTHIGEYFILYKEEGKPRFTRGKVSVNVGELAPDVLAWPLTNTLEEAYHFALTGYREYIEKKYPQAVDLPLFQAPYHFVVAQKEDLARLWMRSEYQDQMKEIQKACKSEVLASFLDEVTHLPFVTVAK